MAAVHATPSREDLATALLSRIGEDLGQICDQDVVLALRLVEEQSERAAGADKVHISFRIWVNRWWHWDFLPSHRCLPLPAVCWGIGCL